MDAAESDGALKMESAGATEVERSAEVAIKSTEMASTAKTASTSDDAKARSSRRKPSKTHRVVDSEDDGEEDEEENFDGYLKERITEGLSKSAGRGNTAVDDDDEDEDDEGEMEEEEEEEFEDQDPLHLPEGTVVVQPVAVEDSASNTYAPDIPYGRKTRTDVIPDHVMCTACEHRIPTNSIDHFYRHPVLRVLLCRRCITVYETKPVCMGDDGLDDACRWCAEGGDLICCDFCNNAFCKGCIERNLGRQELHSILNAGDNEKWHCYVCHPQLLAKHVELCNTIIASVEEREKVARRRQKSGITRSPRQNQGLPGRGVSQMAAIPDTAALASAIASQVISANAGRRGVGRPRGRGSLTHGTSKGDVLYIRTPGGGVVGIPANSMDQLANVPLMPGSIPRQTQVRQRQSSRGFRLPRGSSHRSQFLNLPSLPMTSVTLSSSPPNITEYNVWTVLEKLLAATQSMGMLLGSLKDDLRRTGTNLVAVEQLKKRREVAMKLWRAFVAYKKSFLDIEMFTRDGSAAPGTPHQASSLGPASRAAAKVLAKQAVKEIVENEDQSEKGGDGIVGVAQKRAAQHEAENIHEIKKKCLESEQQSLEDAKPLHQDTDAKCKDEEEGIDGEDSEEEGEETEGAENKGDNVFGSMHFEPLFEIKPIAKKD